MTKSGSPDLVRPGRRIQVQVLTPNWGPPLPDPHQLGGFPRYALGVLSPLAGSDTMPYGLYRLLGADFIVISASLALQSFAPEDLDHALAAIDPQIEHLVSRG